MLIAHLSDTHFTAGHLAGMPAMSGYQALTRVQALDPLPDCILITGDLVDSGERVEYESALAMLNAIDLPVHVVPGNHDHAPTMLRTLADTPYVRPASHDPERCYYRIDYPGIRLLCCDSSLPGRHYGALGETQLRWLDSQLAIRPEVPAVLAMHHHPVPSGIAVMDRVMLSDADALAQVLSRHPPLRRILIGHLHRSMVTMFAGAVVTCASSTYRQVFLDLSVPGKGAFVDEPPTFLLHHFTKDNVVTHIVPIVHSGPPVGVIGTS